MVTLEEITQKERRILLDQSAIGMELRKNRINTREIKIFTQFLKRATNIFTIPEVIQEAEKIGVCLRRRDYSNDLGLDYSVGGTSGEVLYLLIEQLRKKELDFGSIPQYKRLEEIVFFLEDKLKIKRKDSKSLKTDEKLVATAMYLVSYGSDSRIAIVSNDGHFFLLLKCCMDILMTKDFVPENERLVRGLIGRGIRLYEKGRSKDFNLWLNTSRYTPNKRYRLAKGYIKPLKQLLQAA